MNALLTYLLHRFIPHEYSLQLMDIYSLDSTLLTTTVPPYLSTVSIYLSASSADAAVECPADSLLGAKCIVSSELPKRCGLNIPTAHAHLIPSHSSVCVNAP